MPDLINCTQYGGPKEGHDSNFISHWLSQIESGFLNMHQFIANFLKYNNEKSSDPGFTYFYDLSQRMKKMEYKEYYKLEDGWKEKAHYLILTSR